MNGINQYSEEMEYYCSELVFESFSKRHTDKIDKLEQACNDFYESHHYFTENVLNDLGEGIKSFFRRLKEIMEDFKRKIIEAFNFNERSSSVANAVSYKMKQKETGKKIRQALDELYEAKKEGKRSVKMVDIKKYSKTVQSYQKSLVKMGQRFADINFKSTLEIDKALREFEDTLNEMDAELDRMWDKPRKMGIDEAITMLENEITGKSVFCQVIEENISSINAAAIAAERLQKKRERNNADCLPHHISIFQKITNAISKFARKHISRFIFGKLLWNIF